MISRQEAVTVLRLDANSWLAAAAQAGKAIGGIAETAQASAKQTTAAMRQLPAQFTDIATQIAGGQNIGLILLQQGGQIRDSFGSIGGALRGIGSLITPTRLALGGVVGTAAALATAAYEGAKESAVLRDTLILTGNAAGLTETRMGRLVDRISSSTGQTVGQVRDLVTTLAASGRVNGQVLESTAESVARVAELSGKAATDVAGQFTGLLRDPARVAAHLNEQYNFLNEAQATRIRQLSDEGRKVEAANLANKALTDALSGQRRELGDLESAWNDASRAAARYWDRFKDIFRPETAQRALESSRKLLGELRDQLADNIARGRGESAVGGQLPFNRGLREQIAREELRLAGLAERIRQENAQADAASARAAVSGNVTDILTGRPDNSPARRRAEELARQAQAAEAAMQRAFDANERAIDRGFNDALRDSQRELEASAIALVERNTEQQKLLDDLVLGNRRANIALISDDRERARATIALDRELAQKRIDALFEVGEDRSAAEAAANQASELALKSVFDDVAKRARENVQDAFGDIFTRVFEGQFDSIGNLFSRLVSRMVAEAASADLQYWLFGKGQGGNLQSIFGNLFGAFGGLFGGGRASGGDVQPGRAYMVGERGPELLLMGGRGGHIVSNAELAGAGASGPPIAVTNHIRIDSSTEVARVMTLVAQGVSAGNKRTMEVLKARGVL